MRRSVGFAVFGLGMVSAGGILLIGNLQPYSDDLLPTGSPAVPVSADRQKPADATADYVQHLVTDSLARPLFTPDRRPIAQLQTNVREESGLPRLSGIMITSSGSRAIFAVPGNNKPEVAVEGGRIGGYIVKSIAMDEVVLIGPRGRQILHPTFDAALPASAAMPPPAVAMPAPAKEATP